MKEWRKKHPESAAKLRHARRCAQGSHTYEELHNLLAVSTSCSGCSEDFSDTLRPTFDHKISIKNGGSNNIGNIQVLCGPCNFSKGAMNDDEWRAKKCSASAGGASR